MKYGYVRVSSKEQNIDRQMAEMRKSGVNTKNIYIDKQSGKDFNRENYQRLKERLVAGDVVIVKSIDRLGRNYDMIIAEWKEIVNTIKADIVVIDMPLLDTRTEGKNLVGKFISDIVLQILSFVAENERENIKKRQAEGIKIAKEKGKHLGRPKINLPKNFNTVATKYSTKVITLEGALRALKMTKSTFYKYLSIFKLQH